MNKEIYKPLKKHPNPIIDEVFNIMDYTYDKNRELIVTPYLGNYGTAAGYVIAINGSPPKGTLFITDLDYSNPTLILYSGGKVKRFKESSKRYFHCVRILREFLKPHINK